MNKLTFQNIENNTYFAEQRYRELKKRLDSYDNDDKKEYRLKKRYCKSCQYLRGGLAGQAFTNFNCKNCGVECSHPNTDLDKYCAKCADEHDVCVKCGGKR